MSKTMITIEELFEKTAPDEVVDIRFFWLPSRKYHKDEHGNWYHIDGEYKVYGVIDDDCIDPNAPYIDEEYSFRGTPADFEAHMAAGYGITLETEIYYDAENSYYVIE